MGPPITPLATAYPSEGIPDEFHAVIWVIYAIAAATAFVGIVMRLQKGWPRSTEEMVAVVVILTGLVPFAWHFHIYRIDYVPYYQDGTKASPPIWRAMAIPALPVVCGCALLLLKRRRQAANQRGLVLHATKPNQPAHAPRYPLSREDQQ